MNELNTKIKKLYKQIVLMVFRNGVFRLFPDKLFISVDYFISTKKILKLSKPITFSEKIQWIKIYGGLEKYTKYIDKYEVRDYISKTIGKKYLIPLLGEWEKFEDIQFNKLPQKFILKATHGSGYNYICQDKSSLDRGKLKKIVGKWMQENYYNISREVQYKHCKRKIICEEYLEDDSGGLRDYKFFCFNGEPYFIQVDSDRYSQHKRDFMNLNWEKLPIVLAHPNSDSLIKKTKKLNEMIGICKKLSRIFPFVRVDLYKVNNQVFFGELTFTPGNGFEIFNPLKIDYELGKLIDLNRYKSIRKR